MTGCWRLLLVSSVKLVANECKFFSLQLSESVVSVCRHVAIFHACMIIGDGVIRGMTVQQDILNELLILQFSTCLCNRFSSDC